MSFGTLMRMDSSAGFPAAELIFTWHLTVVAQENCAGSRFEPKAALALQGWFFSRVEKIVRGGSGSIHRQTPSLPDRQVRNGEIDRPAIGIKQDEQVGLSMSWNQARKGLPALIGPIRGGAVWREPLDVSIRVEAFAS